VISGTQPESLRRKNLLNTDPVLEPGDISGLPLEQQCLLEVIQEQSQKANQAAVANGAPDDVTYKVTAKMVEAKMKEKQPK
jgi:hypothetical protein